MKTINTLLLTLFALITLPAMAQEISTKDGFALKPATNSIVINQGGTQEIDVEVLRSKRYAQKKIELSIQGAIPEGLSVNITQPTPELSGKLEIIAGDNASGGNYMLVLQGKTSRITKASLIKVVINSETISAR